MAKKERDYTEHYALARQKAKELGYNNLSMLDLEKKHRKPSPNTGSDKMPIPQGLY